MGRGETVRQSAALTVVLLAVLFLLPLKVVVPFQTELFFGEEQPKEREETSAEGVSWDEGRTLKVLDDGTVQDLDLRTYLTGVVRAEMPASFEPEALKAQAVAARTYTLYKISSGGNHGGQADLCTDPACCQAYLGEAQARENWGDQADAYEAKVAQAVTDTDGQAILYQGEPILAAFHSSSAGRTRTSGAVWQKELPYLQPVDSPEPTGMIPNYYSRAEISAEEVKGNVLAAYPEANFSGSKEGWLQNAKRDSAGNVESVEIGGVTVKGNRLRSLLGLRSACFEWSVEGQSFVFLVTGYGHGVGLSQYGANQMAAEGANYREILSHYYTDVTIGIWK